MLALPDSSNRCSGLSIEQRWSDKKRAQAKLRRVDLPAVLAANDTVARATLLFQAAFDCLVRCGGRVRVVLSFDLVCGVGKMTHLFVRKGSRGVEVGHLHGAAHHLPRGASSEQKQLQCQPRVLRAYFEAEREALWPNLANNCILNRFLRKLLILANFVFNFS